ncbi:MAG: HAD family hydrolase [Chloroflexi bacterium]|nr:HAD family hydrolase [Chloroflexota bacterium]
MIYPQHEAVLFDLDGTLLNTLDDITDSVNEVLRRNGLPEHRPEVYKAYIGDGVEDLTARSIPENHRDPTTIARLTAAIREEYGRRWADRTRPYEGITNLLDELTNASIKMAILSNKPDDLTKLAVSRLLSRWQFELVLGAGPTVPKKPNPAAAIHIAGRLRIVPVRFLYLGDGDTDMKTANEAGMYAVGALWGFRSADDLLAAGARALIAKPMALMDLL